jgi:TonB family protein
VRIAEFSGQWEGRLIDAFPLRQFLGAGESSTVFLTTYETRPAAIKLVQTEPQAADAQLCRWRAASKLSHPNLIRIFSTGRAELDGLALLYVVMEYAEENLSQVLPERSLTTAETRAMLEPTLAALDYIHRLGFVHGHLKPANIMAVDDQVKISSDGLCRLGTNCGDPPSLYDSPERANTNAGDIWSLGMVLVEVLTQRLPQGGLVPSGLPDPFGAIALHCLDRNPADRWTLPQISQRLGVPPPVATPKRRYVMPVGVPILLVLLIVLVVGVMVNRSQTVAPAPAPVQEAPRETAKAPEPESKKPVTAVKSPVAAKAPEAAPPQSVMLDPNQPDSNQPDPNQPDPNQPMPDITDHDRSTIHGRVNVDVTVDVDSSGMVTNAKLDHPGRSKYLSASALKAARQWKFKPAAVDGRDAAQHWRLRFEFRSTGTTVQRQRLSP